MSIVAARCSNRLVRSFERNPTAAGDREARGTLADGGRTTSLGERYSARSATIGSTRIARRAGTRQPGGRAEKQQRTVTKVSAS